MSRLTRAASAVSFALLSCHAFASGGVLNVYNWGEYFAPDTIARFEKETGIKVRLDTYDSNEILQAKILTGNTGYDIVFPSNDFMARQIRANVYQKIDRNKLANYRNLDPAVLKKAAEADPDNQYSVPYMLGTTGLGINVDKVKKALGGKLPDNTYDLIFKPEVAARLKDCGIALTDAPSAIFPMALRYMGRDPNSKNPKDYQDAAAMLKTVRPYIRQFISTPVMNDLARGNVCVTTGYSGAVLVAKTRAAEAKNGQQIAYDIPKPGVQFWFDSMLIPKDAKNVDNAYRFIDYILRPDVVARISDTVNYPNPNKAATPMVAKRLTGDANIYLSPEKMQALWVQKPFEPQLLSLQMRLWTGFKTRK
ncbi:polyamine ABC transporter substrate-binding protein [Crenobacter cavernae]|uniref:Putrescine-binding periplasmic protein n=1 Tax=Crenobacter cavernae TaxID=2290923 RepID=A0ABY0F9W2_9NEIS|nr:polyamine ABC transporter substrate-binding protein [Crenobacter cavernae]RXZ42451.1 polyamine ABC transporter substrate-binding protein [Crenobacter cavernae]